MARIRAIHPRAPQDDDVASMSLPARYLWAYLPCHADREGRMEERPLMLKGEVFPADVVDVAALLGEMEERRFIIRYRGDKGRRLIQIRNFRAYQRPDHRERVSILQAPDGWQDVGQNPGKGKALSQETVGSVGQNPGLDLGKATECNVSSYNDTGQDRSGTPVSGTDISPRAHARSNPPANNPGKPTAFNVVAQFLAIRAEHLQVKNGFAQPQPGELDKAARWLEAMPLGEVADIEPAFRLAFGHVKSGDVGWTKSEHAKVAFMFGAVLSRWTDLREELHGQKPQMPEAKDGARPGQSPGRVVPIVES
jgi:hypothetical protein